MSLSHPRHLTLASLSPTHCLLPTKMAHVCFLALLEEAHMRAKVYLGTLGFVWTFCPEGQDHWGECLKVLQE